MWNLNFMIAQWFKTPAQASISLAAPSYDLVLQVFASVLQTNQP